MNEKFNEIDWTPPWYEHPILPTLIGCFVLLAIGLFIIALI